MLPITRVPEMIAKGMAKFRSIFCRDEGFEHVSRYVTGLILSPNKTLQGMYDLQVWERQAPSRRAMHAGVFEAGWDDTALMQRHRAEVAGDYRGRGRTVLSLDWTLVHHERGPQIYGVKRVYDYVAHRTSLLQTVVTAVVANRQVFDGLDVVVQNPHDLHAEEAYLQETAKGSYEQMDAGRQRLLELLHYHLHQRLYRKRTELVVALVRQLEAEGHFPQANYAFDNGVLTVELSRLIEGHGKHWVSEIECSRHINWQGRWRRVDAVATELRAQHPESFRMVTVTCRNGATKSYWIFTKVVRLKKYGTKRLAIVHEQEELHDTPRYFLTDAKHWESTRIMETWSYRWTSEVFHEFDKQVCGMEAAQVRKEEAVTRHFRLSCIAQSLIQRTPAVVSKSERYAFAEGHITFGQKCRTISREVLRTMLALCQRYFAEGKTCDQVLELLRPV
jgi:hypothetical protein